MSTPNTWAKAAVKNDFGTEIHNVTLKHRYDNDHYDKGSWDAIPSGEESSAISVGYWTGFLRTGKDYWWISFEALGKIWTCKSNFYCFLREDDDYVRIIVSRDGDNAKMYVDCPVSGDCTVSLDGANDLSFRNWMEQNYGELKSRNLSEISLPGSHNAGMYKAHGCTFGGSNCNTQTQADTISQQLTSGIRYFDLRPVYDDGSFYTGHFSTGEKAVIKDIQGCLGGSLDVALNDVNIFAMLHSEELVILRFSHYLNKEEGKEEFDDTIMSQLTSKVKKILGTHLVTIPNKENLLSLTFGDILAKGSVIALFDGVETDWQTGILNLNTLPIYDQYSDTNDFATMKEDQFKKLETHGGNHGQLFLLSWTLTQNPTQAAGCKFDILSITHSIKDLANKANFNLLDVLDNQESGANRFNILYTDYCDTFPTWICLSANGLPGGTRKIAPVLAPEVKAPLYVGWSDVRTDTRLQVGDNFESMYRQYGNVKAWVYVNELADMEMVPLYVGWSDARRDTRLQVGNQFEVMYQQQGSVRGWIHKDPQPGMVPLVIGWSDSRLDTRTQVGEDFEHMYQKQGILGYVMPG